MKIDRVEVGYLKTNCYILSIDNKVLVIDPGAEFFKISPFLKNDKVLACLLTHKHFDHVGALDEVINEYNTPIYSYENLEEKEYTIGPFTFKVIYTKGHTNDSITFYFEKEKVLFTGDFLFKETVGRCDLGGNFLNMQESIKKIKKYPIDLKVYPGHGEFTSLEYEINNNPYFKEG